MSPACSIAPPRHWRALLRTSRRPARDKPLRQFWLAAGRSMDLTQRRYCGNKRSPALAIGIGLAHRDDDLLHPRRGCIEGEIELAARRGEEFHVGQLVLEIGADKLVQLVPVGSIDQRAIQGFA